MNLSIRATSPSASTTAQIGVERSGVSALGCNSDVCAICWRMSGEALKRTQSRPSADAARFDCVRWSMPAAPARAARLSRQLEFHCGKLSPADDPTIFRRKAVFTSRHSLSPIEIETLEATSCASRLVMAYLVGERCVPPGTRTSTAYFLGAIPAGRYREISKLAGTWHMFGLVQLFFICFSCCAGPKGPIQSLISHCEAPVCQWLAHHFENGQ